MTITAAIDILKIMKERHGDIEVLFDCPNCGKSTKPDMVVAMAVVQALPPDEEKK